MRDKKAVIYQGYGAPAGERNGNAKLTVDQVRQIRKELRQGRSVRSLAGKYNVSTMAISGIKLGTTWKQVK
jgi:hypothetical protein